jgi:two-component system sensor histidine kinase FlrB
LRAARETGRELELLLPSRSGTAERERWVAIRHAWLEQQHCTSVFILRDITEIKAMEHDRELLRRREALAEVSGLLAHEIRNPLGSLELFAGLLAEAKLPEDNRRWVEHIQAGLRTLSATVNNVLQLHKEAKPKLMELDFGELLDWAYGFLLPLARQAGINLRVFNALRQVFYPADRHYLEQVLLNLALNALRFTPPGGWLAIAGEELDCAGLEITVRDSGSGIAPENLSRIFEAGFSTQPGSSGLGLAVCRQIVEQHAGKILVESNLGRGTAFRLRFPRSKGKNETVALS